LHTGQIIKIQRSGIEEKQLAAIVRSTDLEREILLIRALAESDFANILHAAIRGIDQKQFVYIAKDIVRNKYSRLIDGVEAALAVYRGTGGVEQLYIAAV
jgi:hypothetical protein